MTKLTAILIVAVVAALMAGVHSDDQVEDKGIVFQTISLNQLLASICNVNIDAFWTAFCNSFSTTTSTSTSTTTTTTITTTTDDVEDSSSTTTTEAMTSPATTGPDSTLERAHWCSLNNGSYLSLGYTFMHAECLLCQCLISRAIQCTTLQCMPTYCIDDSAPIRQSGQCCQQCSYDNQSIACVISGVAFPHGTILRRSGDTLQCWCQMGSVECRKGSGSVFSSLDLWGEGTAVYVIIVFIGLLLIVGTLICGGCGLFFYYYYQRTQQSAQQAYEEYYNNAGWQPMGEDGEVVDASTAEKQAEAEQNLFKQEYRPENSEKNTPPPYFLSNDSRTDEENVKDQKYL